MKKILLLFISLYFIGCTSEIKNKAKIIGVNYALFGTNDRENFYFVNVSENEEWLNYAVLINYDLEFYEGEPTSNVMLYENEGVDGSDQKLLKIRRKDIFEEEIIYDSLIDCKYSYWNYIINDSLKRGKRYFPSFGCYIKEFNINTNLSSAMVNGINSAQFVWLSDTAFIKEAKFEFEFDDTLILANKIMGNDLKNILKRF